MQVLVDTTVWSLALRRRTQTLSSAEERITAELAELVREGRCELTGIVRQEILSGIRSREQFEKLRQKMRAFSDEPLAIEDHEKAAEANHECRRLGIAGSLVDFLLCAISIRRSWSIFTTDPDFLAYAKVLPLHLHLPRS